MEVLEFMYDDTTSNGETVNTYWGNDVYGTSLDVHHNITTGEIWVGTIDMEFDYHGTFEELIAGLESGEIHYWLDRADCQPY